MDSIRKIYTQQGSLHHAYLIIGDQVSSAESVVDFIEKDLKFSTKGNPDFIIATHDTFGVDEARALKSATAMRPIDEKKFVLLSIPSITTEAQNSLLKIFEEPVGSTVFFVIAPTLEIFIPTLLSRFFIVNSRNEKKSNEKHAADSKNNKEKTFAKKFFAASVAERMSLVENIVEKKDKIGAIDFFNSIENFLSEALHKKNADPRIVSACNEVIKYKSYLYDRSPSIKMLLQHISCTIPVLDKN